MKATTTVLSRTRNVQVKVSAYILLKQEGSGSRVEREIYRNTYKFYILYPIIYL